MGWKVHHAYMIGCDHEHQKKNRQDFCHVIVPSGRAKERYCGIVCDGCSEGLYSETGAALLGTLLLNFLCTTTISDELVLRLSIEKLVGRFIGQLITSIGIKDQDLKAGFIKHFLLSTFIFVVIHNNGIVIGNAGDGIIVINNEISIIDQEGTPHYLSYRSVPKDFMTPDYPAHDDLSIRLLKEKEVYRVVIATDGLKPLIERKRTEELFGTEKRQLQRKFNLWQQKEKLFHDDVACIVCEKENG
jgi:hypothetical protein